MQTDAVTVFEPEDLDIEEGMIIEFKGVPVDIAYSAIISEKVPLEEEDSIALVKH